MPFLGRYIIYNYKFICLLRMSQMTVSATLTFLSGPFTLNKQHSLHRGFPALPVRKPSTTPPARSTSFIAFAYGLAIWLTILSSFRNFITCSGCSLFMSTCGRNMFVYIWLPSSFVNMITCNELIEFNTRIVFTRAIFKNNNATHSPGARSGKRH